MSLSHARTASVHPIWIAGLLSLAVAMGIGRFAFTPLMPLMMRDGLIDAAAGAELAAANYIGYLLGAWTAPRLAASPLRLLRGSLLAVVLLTAASAALAQGPVAWLVRGGAGVASAWVMVGASSWCLRELAGRGQAALGAWVYCGVGSGILLAGLLAWLGGRQTSVALWLELSALALAGALVVQWLLRGAGGGGATPGVPTPPAAATDAPAAGRHRAAVWCYGSFGFGYIVPATFLPAMARQQIEDPLVFGIAWPLFGLAAALSVAGAARWLSGWPRRRVWTWAQAVMTVGAALPLLGRSPLLLACAAVLVGGTFMVATMAGLQWARELEPAQPTLLLARMTAAFAAGQIGGPLVVRLAAPWLPPTLDAIALGSALAALALAAGWWWLWRGAPLNAAAAPRG